MYLLRFRTILAGAMVATLSACDLDPPRDVAGSDAGTSHQDGSASTDPNTLRVAGVMLLDDLTTNGLSLVPGEVMPISLRLADLVGEPVEGARVEIALIGQSMNSTASALVDYSAGDGVVSFYVQAGSVPTSFQLRVTAGVVETYIPIVVLNALTGTVAIEVAGPIELQLASATMRAYANRRCADLGDSLPASATSTVTTNAYSGTAVATLFEGASYALVVVAETDSGATLRACVDEITFTTGTVDLSLLP